MDTLKKPVGDWRESLYESKATPLVLYGRALGLSHSEAEDVLQETFVALMRLESPPEQPEHYCVRSYRNRALNFKRSLWRRVARELESARWFERTPDETPEELDAMRCLAKLPRDQREVIVLKIWHQHTFEEIGRFLVCPANTAAGRYRYGMEKLRGFLKGEKHEQHRRFEQFGEETGILGSAPGIGAS